MHGLHYFPYYSWEQFGQRLRIPPRAHRPKEHQAKELRTPLRVNRPARVRPQINTPALPVRVEQLRANRAVRLPDNPTREWPQVARLDRPETRTPCAGAWEDRPQTALTI